MPIKRQNEKKNVIYYVPHQDDEALGFSLAIKKDLELGNNVEVLIYMPKRTDSGLLDIMRGYDDNQIPKKCPLVETYPEKWKNHPEYHNEKDWDIEKVINVRQEEFIRTLLALGVKKENIKSTEWGDEKANKEQYFGGQRQLVADMYNKILNNEKRSPGTIHNCIAGPKDCYPWGNQVTILSNPTDQEKESKISEPNDDHIACWTAANQLIKDNDKHKLNFDVNQFIFYDNYVWFATADDTHYAFTKTPIISNTVDKILLEQYKNARTISHNIYKEWDPNNNKYALGFHSVHNLFYGSENDYNIYVEHLGGYNNDLNEVKSFWDNGEVHTNYPEGFCIDHGLGEIKS